MQGVEGAECTCGCGVCMGLSTECECVSCASYVCRVCPGRGRDTSRAAWVSFGGGQGPGGLPVSCSPEALAQPE